MEDREVGAMWEAFGEPFAGDEALARRPELYDTRIVPLYLHVRCRKPLPGGRP